jgi:signal transduction histidine kinase
MLLGVNPSLVFSNFKNGTYLVEIKVTDNFKNQQHNILQLTIHALPFFYETIWFKLLLPLVITLVLLSVFLFRLRQINKWNKFRTALSQDLHDDAGATLSSVNILSTMLTEQEPLSPKAKIYMQRITDDVKLLQLKLDEIIWSLKKHTGNMQQVYNRLAEYGSFIMEAKQIAFTAEASPDLDHIALPIKKLRNVFLTAKEALNNIAKHSNAKNALLHIIIQEKNICIIIKDDGNGTVVNNTTDRNGITGMHRRIKEIKGNIQVSSVPQQGTAITITLKY